MRGFPGKREKARGNRKIKNMGEGWGSNGGGSRILRIKEEILSGPEAVLVGRSAVIRGHYSFLGAEEGVRALRWRRERRDMA